MEEKYLYFASDSGANNDEEMCVLPLSNLTGINPEGATTLGLYFVDAAQPADLTGAKISLTISSNTHKATIVDIFKAINNPHASGDPQPAAGLYVVVDKDNGIFASSNISDVTIDMTGNTAI